MGLRHWLSGLGLCLAVCVLPAQALDVGDPAPPLKIAEWVRGGPVDLKSGKGKHIYLLEFWATWCPPCRESLPHLSEIQRKYKDKGLVVVAISDEPGSVIRPFMDRMGEKMDFVVAADDRQSTWQTYLGGLGAQGIPHSCIVDKSGIVVWHGSPFEDLDQVVGQILSGKYDIEAAKLAAKAGRLLNDYFQTLMQARFTLEAAQREELGKQAKRISAEFLKAAAKNPDLLGALAWNILSWEDASARDYDLAVQAAKAAFDGAKETAPSDLAASIAHVYARTLWETGQKAEAVRVQKRAVEWGKDPQLIPELQEALKRYEEGAGNPSSRPASQPAASGPASAPAAARVSSN